MKKFTKEYQSRMKIIRFHTSLLYAKHNEDWFYISYSFKNLISWSKDYNSQKKIELKSHSYICKFTK